MYMNMYVDIDMYIDIDDFVTYKNTLVFFSHSDHPSSGLSRASRIPPCTARALWRPELTLPTARTRLVKWGIYSWISMD